MVDPIAKAYELARSGRFKNVTEIKKALRADGFDETAIYGKTLWADLRRLCKQHRNEEA